ncbi:MAG: hypothetical protein M3Q34_01455 [bacterium]|nr:hypothetical protein [bacterium]
MKIPEKIPLNSATIGTAFVGLIVIIWYIKYLLILGGILLILLSGRKLLAGILLICFVVYVEQCEKETLPLSERLEILE